MSLFNNYMRIKTIRTALAEYERTTRTYLGVLGSLETRLVGCFREAKTRQAGRDDVETGMILVARRQDREQLPHLEEVPRP